MVTRDAAVHGVAHGCIAVEIAADVRIAMKIAAEVTVASDVAEIAAHAHQGEYELTHQHRAANDCREQENGVQHELHSEDKFHHARRVDAPVIVAAAERRCEVRADAFELRAIRWSGGNLARNPNAKKADECVAGRAKKEGRRWVRPAAQGVLVEHER
jgi:hypothetical protein